MQLIKANRSAQARKPLMEALEQRWVRASLPYGALANDTGEFLLGRIAVTPVFLESNGQVDPSVENWNPTHRDEVFAKLSQGLEWWNQLIATKTQVHRLDWVIDRTYVDQPAPTVYEPINRPSNDYALWSQEFLMRAGFDQTSSLEDNMRAFNNSQRIKFDADWSFTMFVVNSEVERDGTFAPGGSFSRAFAFAGGLFFVVPSTRPVSTFAHETGHIFWARDEYAGGGSYFLRRGYYDTQNLNAVDGNQTNFQQSPSIMSSGASLQTAYEQLISPASTLAMLGWQDTDSNGIFDVLDVPLLLDGVGRVDLSNGAYRFVGKAQAQTLPNRNTSGSGNDITLNKVSRIEARINGGNWQIIAQPNVHQASIDVSIPLAGVHHGTIEIRAVDAPTGITSNLFLGQIGAIPDAVGRAGISGFAWTDANSNGLFDATESGLSRQVVRLVDDNGQPLNLARIVEPDSQVPGLLPGTAFPGIVLSTVGSDANGSLGVFTDTAATTGTKVFRPYSNSAGGIVDNWSERRQLKIDFGTATSFVAVDVITTGVRSFGRLEVYDSAGNLLDRVTSQMLTSGQSQRLELGRDRADIAYAIVRGHMATGIKIDNLRYGPETQTTTDNFGHYRFPHLPAGIYNVQFVRSGVNALVTSAEGEQQVIVLQASATEQHINFGVHFEESHWHNEVVAQDVNADGTITAIDALLVINLLNQGVNSLLVGSSIPHSPYVDVSNDFFLTAFDALLVINAINRGSSEGEIGTGHANRGDSDSSSGAGQLEGENAAGIGPVFNRYSEPAGPALPPNWKPECLFEQLAIDHETALGDVKANWTGIQPERVDAEFSAIADLSDFELIARLKSNPWSLPVPCTCAECVALQCG